MKFKLKQNLLPKNIKLLQKYMEESEDETYYSEESSNESSYYSSEESESTESENSEESESVESENSEESYDSVSTTERNFSKFMKEYNKKRVYSIKENILSISYNFDTEKVSGKWKRHVDKSIDIYYRFLNTDKESLKNGLMFIEISKL